MSEFRWNGGGSFNGRPWDENLPTDAMVTNNVNFLYKIAKWVVVLI